MIWLTVFLVFLIVVFITTTIIGIVRNLELINKLDELGDQVDQSLDILNECYGKISKKLETPVFSDEPLVKELLLDIKKSRDSVLLVANLLVSFDEENDGDEHVS